MTNGIVFDHKRINRIGLPEAVFCEGKSFEAQKELLEKFAITPYEPILFTRLGEEVFGRMPVEIADRYDYDPLSRTAFNTVFERKQKGSIAIVSAGTSDAPVVWEASRTLTYLGIANDVYEDCGVAGLWRLMEKVEDINNHDAVIAVAGLDAALASVVGGLTPRPVFGVPTSVGYGAAQSGKAALLSMLVSCSPGVSVMNIDNGYGAACAAARVINNLKF